MISIHALLAESDRRPPTNRKVEQIFLSTLSLRRATPVLPPCGIPDRISIHALLAESDSAPQLHAPYSFYFYPRSPCGERRFQCGAIQRDKDFYPRSPCGERPKVRSSRRSRWYFYPRSPCGERPGVQRCRPFQHYFYPRSPCGERLAVFGAPNVSKYISIHALLAESDLQQGPGFYTKGFLSTLSLRRATKRFLHHYRPVNSFYPRSPCGERPRPSGRKNRTTAVSIHALLAESDLLRISMVSKPDVSIHALLAESDSGRCQPHFAQDVFLSTLSLRRATVLP